MKRLRKLLGILLTGVMALTLLAGCAGTASLNEKEILATIKDYCKVSGYYDDDDIETDTTNYAKKAADAIKTYYSDPEKDQTISVEKLVASADYYYNPSSATNVAKDAAEITAAVIPDGSTDKFYLHCIAAEPYMVPSLKAQQNMLIAQSLLSSRSSQLSRPGHSGDKVFLSLCTETFNGKTYIFLIARCPAA